MVYSGVWLVGWLIFLFVCFGFCCVFGLFVFFFPVCLFLPLETFVSAVLVKPASFNQIWQICCRILISVISLTFIEICELVDMRGPTDVSSKGNAATYTDPFFDTRESITARDSINTPSVENLLEQKLGMRRSRYESHKNKRSGFINFPNLEFFIMKYQNQFYKCRLLYYTKIQLKTH